MQNKKIAFFTYDLPFAGGERVLVDLANEISSRGFSVDVVVVKKQGGLLDRVSEDVRVVSLSSSRYLWASFYLAKYLFTNKPQSLVSLTPHTHFVSFVAKALSFSYRTKLVFRLGIAYSKMFKSYTSFKDRVLRYLLWFVYRFGTLVAVSKGVRDDAAHFFGLSKDHIQVIYNPKNIHELQNTVNDSFVLRGEGKHIVSVGRLRKQKDFETLIRSIGLMSNTDISLHIFGGGEEKEVLEKFVQKEGVGDRVYFEGNILNVEKAISKGDIFVSTSKWEGMPNAIIEALAIGLPVIATDCPYGSREVLAPESDYKKMLNDGIEMGSAGILVPIGRPEFVAKAITDILNSPKIQEKYRKAAMHRAQFFDHKKITSEYLDILVSNE